MEDVEYRNDVDHDEVDQLHHEQDILTHEPQSNRANNKVAYSKTICKEEKKANAQVNIEENNKNKYLYVKRKVSKPEPWLLVLQCSPPTPLTGGGWSPS